MTANRFGILLLGLWSIGIAVGFLTAKHWNSMLAGIAGAWLTMTIPTFVFSARFNAAWWSTNVDEARKAGFASEASASLKFVAVVMLLLGIFCIVFGWFRNNIFLDAAFSGSFFAIATFAAGRLHNLSSRKLK